MCIQEREPAGDTHGESFERASKPVLWGLRRNTADVVELREGFALDAWGWMCAVVSHLVVVYPSREVAAANAPVGLEPQPFRAAREVVLYSDVALADTVSDAVGHRLVVVFVGRSATEYANVISWHIRSGFLVMMHGTGERVAKRLADDVVEIRSTAGGGSERMCCYIRDPGTCCAL